jgi:hypothetical protein
MGGLGAAEVNRVLVARNNGLGLRILPRATFKAKLLPCNTREWTGCPWGRTEAQSDGSLTQPSAAYAGTIPARRENALCE